MAPSFALRLFARTRSGTALERPQEREKRVTFQKRKARKVAGPRKRIQSCWCSLRFIQNGTVTNHTMVPPRAQRVKASRLSEPLKTRIAATSIAAKAAKELSFRRVFMVQVAAVASAGLETNFCWIALKIT